MPTLQGTVATMDLEVRADSFVVEDPVDIMESIPIVESIVDVLVETEIDMLAVFNVLIMKPIPIAPRSVKTNFV